jgi:hypothetical protein
LPGHIRLPEDLELSWAIRFGLVDEFPNMVNVFGDPGHSRECLLMYLERAHISDQSRL